MSDYLLSSIDLETASAFTCTSQFQAHENEWLWKQAYVLTGQNPYHYRPAIYSLAVRLMYQGYSWMRIQLYFMTILRLMMIISPRKGKHREAVAYVLNGVLTDLFDIIEPGRD